MFKKFFQKNTKNEAEERKIKSIKYLKKYKIPYIENLPVIETQKNIKIRTKEEIAKRAITSLLTVQIACDMMNNTENIEQSVEIFSQIIDRFKLKEELTENEKKFFTINEEIEKDEKILNLAVTKQEALDMVWKYEACLPLFWALGIVDKLKYPSKICDVNILINSVKDCENFEQFMDKVKLKNVSNWLDEADLIYRLDWACVDARIKGNEPPQNLNSSVVLERHKGLNWLISAYESQDWDNVATHT